MDTLKLHTQEKKKTANSTAMIAEVGCQVGLNSSGDKVSTCWELHVVLQTEDC